MRIKNFLNTIKVFLISYIISSFVTTCSLLIYLSSLMETLGHEFTEVEIREASIITFTNILIIALLFTFLYYIVKKITVDIPIKKIKNCLSSLMNGDFSARVKIKNNALSTSTFDEIAEDINKLAQELGGVEMLRNDFISSILLALAVAIISDISIIQCPCSLRYTFSSSSFRRSSENHSSFPASSRKKVDFPAP